MCFVCQLVWYQIHAYSIESQDPTDHTNRTSTQMQLQSYVIHRGFVKCPNLSICFTNTVRSEGMVHWPWLQSIIQLLQSAFMNFCINLQMLYLDNHDTAYGLHSAMCIPCFATFRCQKLTDTMHLQLST
jgi:hypothetical protein